MPGALFYMHRCLELAQNGSGHVSPNPLVGCLIVHNDVIIGEGWHQTFGGPHAEVNAINSVVNVNLLNDSTLYVNLEPCSHWGKTPPCADLIIKNKIPKVVIAMQDPFAEVAGRGIKRLQDAGIMVTSGILEKQAQNLNRRFITFHTKKRPYIILKWAVSADGYMAAYEKKQVWISNAYSKLLSQRLRLTEDAILVGTSTALIDDPILTSRDVGNRNSIRILIDKDLKVPKQNRIFNNDARTIVFTEKQTVNSGAEYIEVNFQSGKLPEIISQELYNRQIQSVIIEGGRKTLDAFIDCELWDEAVIIRSNSKYLQAGIEAPQLPYPKQEDFQLGDNNITTFLRNVQK